MNKLSRLHALGPEAGDNPYLPYLSALESGIIKNPEDMIAELSEPPGVTIANGLIPNNRGAGIVALGEQLGAFDLSRIEFRDKEIEVAPISKSAVEHDTGRITSEGAIVLELGDGRIRLAGFAIDMAQNPWLAHDLLGSSMHRQVRNIAVVALSSLDVPEYEITEVNTDSGAVYGRERVRIF